MTALRDLKPMLLDERPLDVEEAGWIYEIKFDGYRLLAEFWGGKCELRTRQGADATRWFPEVAQALASVSGGPYVTDGEDACSTRWAAATSIASRTARGAGAGTRAGPGHLLRL